MISVGARHGRILTCFGLVLLVVAGSVSPARGGETVTLAEAVTEATPPQGGDLIVSDVSSLSALGGAILIEPGSSNEEFVSYAAADPGSDTLIGISRVHPVDHPAGASVEQAQFTDVDLGDVNETVEGFLPPVPDGDETAEGVVDVAVTEGGDGHCSATADEPYIMNPEVIAGGTFTCLHNHDLKLTVRVQIRISGQWHNMGPGVTRTRDNRTTVSAQDSAACIEDKWWYRSKSVGIATVSVGGNDVVHDRDRDYNKSDTRLFCEGPAQSAEEFLAGVEAVRSTRPLFPAWRR